MAAVTGRAAGFIAKLYYKSAVIATKNETNIEAALDSEVIDVSSMGALSKQRNIIDIPVYGEDVAGKLPGQADPGTFDFTVTMNLNNAIHTEFRDDDGKTEHTFIVEFDQTTDNKTYAAFDGYIGNATMNQAIDGAITMDVSVARSGDVTWVDNS